MRPPTKAIRLPFVALLALCTAACAGSTSEAPVLPFEEIQASEVTIDFDASATSAILRVETTVPVVCAVVYGTNGDFGMIATDDDMRGGAHSQHGPLMGGLEPETEYSYRLQGSDSDGNIYASETMTFRTPPASESTGPGTNVATQASVAEVSSEFSSSFAASNAIDGDPTTEWSSNGDGDDAYLTLDLGGETSIVAVAFRTRAMSDGSSITQTFTVTIGEETFGPFPAGDDPIEMDATGDLIRFDVESSTGGNTGAVEIEVYASD